MDLRAALSLLAPNYVEPTDESTRRRLTWRIGDTLATPTIEHLRALWVVLRHARSARDLRADLERRVRAWQRAGSERQRNARLRELSRWCRLRERQIMAAIVRGLALTPVVPDKLRAPRFGPLRARPVAAIEPQDTERDKKPA